MIASVAILASLVVGPLQLDRPVWLWLIPALAVLVVWIGRSSLAGLGSTTRWLALGTRLIVIALLTVVLAEPSLRRTANDVAVTVVLDASDSINLSLQSAADRFIEQATASRQPGDRLGLLTVASDAYVQALPSRLITQVERRFVGPTQGTDLATGLRLAMAVAPQDAANRLVLASDGNETAGSLLEVARAAKAAGIPIDVIPLRYRHEGEVIVDRVIAPATARQGQIINVKIAFTATKAARGFLSLRMNSELVDLDPGSDSLRIPIELQPGANVHAVQIMAVTSGPKTFEARFEPVIVGGVPQGDAITQNNIATGVTFVSGEGRVLVVREDPAEAALLVRTLREAGIGIEVMPSSTTPIALTDLAGYDAIVLVNEPAYNFTEEQQGNLARYVHDAGGGLVMIGGPDSFGAGGWIGSTLAAVLPVRLDPPQKREMPKGALVLVMHSIEMPQGVFYGKQVATAAVDALSRLDLIGIVEYNAMTGRGSDWVHDLQPVGDRSSVRRSIKSLTFGDMPSFDPSLRTTLAGLKKVDAGQKHVILISDGDPSLTPSLLTQFKAARISISTVGVNPHSPGDLRGMRLIAQATGGTFYNIPNNKLNEVVKIFVKEARLVRRSLIWEGNPFAPKLVLSGAPSMTGIRGVPQIRGYVVTADRGGLSQVTLRGKENDPIAAVWQHGLGRAVVFTSDAGARWATDWAAWPGYRQFWEQHIRWAMRPTGSANLRILTEQRGDQTHITIEALDEAGEHLAAGSFAARVAGPNNSATDLTLRQTGPGRWEGVIETEDAGTYLVGVRFKAIGRDGQPIEGTAQAAITRPFGDEFRALQDNTALLRQVADMTGGRVLDLNDPAAADLWRREGLTMPVATRAIWLTLLFIAVALFLVDVAVRRVRIDLRAIAAFIAASMQTSRQRAGSQLDALHAARAKARQRIAERSDAPDEPDDTALRAQLRAQRQSAKARFEASPDQAKRMGSKPVALSGQDEPGTPKRKKSTPKPTTDSPDEGLARLMAAKKRARKDIDET